METDLLKKCQELERGIVRQLSRSGSGSLKRCALGCTRNKGIPVGRSVPLRRLHIIPGRHYQWRSRESGRPYRWKPRLAGLERQSTTEKPDKGYRPYSG